jgi:hypothetical protein
LIDTNSEDEGELAQLEENADIVEVCKVITCNWKHADADLLCLADCHGEIFHN